MNSPIDNLHHRPTVNLGKTNEIPHYSQKEHPKISRIAKFGGEMLQNTENTAPRSLQILYIPALRDEKVTIFELKLWQKW